jgi:ABC-type bacteriocin/lantibiotic exporter with double-glycine peptidase domain
MKQKNNRVDFTVVLLLLVQAVMFFGIAVVVYVSIPDPAMAIVLIVINGCLTFLAKLYYDYINRRNLNDAAEKIKKTIAIIKNDEPWKTPNFAYDDEIKDIVDSMGELYDSLRHQEAARTRVLNMVNTVTSNMEIEKLFEDLMPKLVENLNSNWGAFYLANNATGKL